MPAAALPPDEAVRLAALQRLSVLDSPPEAEFDALVQAASLVCGVPISLISLVDADRQWFKANHGLPGASQTPREQAFCAHAILGPALFEVPDTTIDPRFVDNPLVTGAPDIRFYAGVPLTLADGQRVGTLCVIDRTPRQLTDHQRQVLQALGTAAARALETRRAVLAERQLLQAQDQLKSEFLATAAHELRTPMTSIYGFTELLVTREDLPAEQQRALLLRIHRQCESLMAVTTDLLDLAHLEARGARDLQCQPLCLTELVKAMLRDFNPANGREAPQCQPPHHAALPVQADPVKLRQVLGNLLSNAYKYSPDGGPVTVSLLHDPVRGRALLQVSDQGIGMTPEQRARVTEKFYRADRSGHIPGTGLGLAIVKELVGLMGGELLIHSRFGQGTEVQVSLPLSTGVACNCPLPTPLPAPLPMLDAGPTPMDAPSAPPTRPADTSAAAAF